MIKLNKCRTLYKFDEETLKKFLGQSQQSGQTNPEESKEGQSHKESETQSNNDQTKTSQVDVQEGKASAEPATTKEQKTNEAQNTDKNSEEKKSDAALKESSENLENTDKKQEASSQDTQYLYFDADEFLITTYQNESGWWCGYKDTGDNEAAQKLGYFPSNFVQVIEVYEVPTTNAEGVDENANMDEAFTWGDYAKYSYLNNDKILIEERTKKLNDHRAPEHRNQEGILGYKKIKIHETRSHALNPAKGGKVITSQVAIKDQSATSKAYRQMHHYFDYDAWVDQRNSNPVPKAKADPSKKKAKKKTLDW